MNQEWIAKVEEEFAKRPRDRTFVTLRELSYELGLMTFYLNNQDTVLEILKPYVFFRISANKIRPLINYDGFKLFHKFALEYEKNSNELTEKFLKKKN